MTNTPPSGTVTFLFTDIEGSTSMWERYPTKMSNCLERHDEILCSAIEDHEGYVFKTVGDAFCATFPNPRKALCAALEAQRALFAERWGKPIRSLRVRMALHTGYAEMERDGDYFGPAVNRVARLMSVAHGGQVLLSGTTHDQVRHHPELVDEQARLLDLGEHRLKDLIHPERVSQLAVPDLPERFPPLRTAEAPEEDRYRIKAFLGGGGMAKVYLAHDEELDREVAYKVLHPWYLDDEEFVERFEREARNAAKLNHPNIVSIFDRGEKEDGAYYMVMEHLQGGTLRNLIKREALLPTHEALEMTLQIAQALSEAHEQGVIHRDIKPENVLLNKRGDVKVGDFGIAKAAAASTRLTRTGIIPGTAAYVSPEQIKGEEATFRSDLYALGIVLYEMLTKELPFGGKTTEEILRKHLYEQARPPREINPGVPDRVEALCTRLMAKDPNERYPNAGALIEDLKGMLYSLKYRETAVNRSLSGGTVQVPDLVGKSIPLAGEALANEGLKLGEREEAPSETVPEGEVVRQSPEVGTEVEAGSPVSVTVSTGASTIEVPDLGSLNRSEASRALTAVGLKLGGYHEAPNETTPEGEITAQHPPAHTKARRGSSVSITVSTGPQKVTVPDLSKQTPPKAREMLAAAGLKFGPQDEAPSDAVSEGKIIKQYPVAGTKTERGSSVSVAISLGTSTVEVPDLAGLKHSEASSMLAAAGLKLGDQIEAPNDNVPEGRIVSQYPAAGTRVSPDSPISIMVSTSLESALVSDITGESAPVLPIRVPSRLSSFIGGFFALVCSSVLWYFSGGGYVIVWPILFLSYFLGGYVAGRLARSNSGRNGAATVLWSILLFFILALFGAFLPGPISRPLSVFAQGSVRPAIGSLVEAGLMGLGIVGALLLVLFLGGFLGGRLGNRRIADLVLRFYRARV